MKRLKAILIALMIVICPVWADGNRYIPVGFEDFEDNGNITAIVRRNGLQRTNVEVGIFTQDGECRSTTRSDSEGVLYITTFGDERFNIEFRVFDHALQKESIFNPQLSYTPNMILGSKSNPYVIDAGGLCGDIDDSGSVDILDITTLIDIYLSGDSSGYGVVVTIVDITNAINTYLEG